MSSPRSAVWVSSLLYGAVLAAGLYHYLGYLDRPLPLAGFLGGIGMLFALDWLERRRYPAGTPRGPAVGLLCLRLLLFVAVASFDSSGLARILLVLAPFTAYFAFGRLVSVILGVACVAVVVAGFSLTEPRWYADIEYVSDLDMFIVAVILSVAMAAVAVNERDSRSRLEVSHARLAAYADQVAELSAATERVRVARDIHDGLGHHLTAISVLLEKASVFSERDPAASHQAIADARESARRALEDVRRSVRTLRTEPEPEPFSLPAALADLVRYAGDGQLTVTLDVMGDESGCDLPTRTALFRAAQEALTNVRRHARARRVSVRLDFEGSGAELVVADDGRGLTTQREGFGLIGMRERIQLVGGRVDLRSGPVTGTCLTVTVPAEGTGTVLGGRSAISAEVPHGG